MLRSPNHNQFLPPRHALRDNKTIKEKKPLEVIIAFMGVLPVQKLSATLAH
jgi:hypothetical protein